MSAVANVIEMPARERVERPRHLHVVPDSVERAGAPQVRRAMLARRRLAVALAILVVALGALLAGRAMASPAGADARTVTVQAGETLSQIAAREMPSKRTAEAVVEIERINGLGSAHVDAGQSLVLPTP